MVALIPAAAAGPFRIWRGCRPDGRRAFLLEADGVLVAVTEAELAALQDLLREPPGEADGLFALDLGDAVVRLGAGELRTLAVLAGQALAAGDGGEGVGPPAWAVVEAWEGPEGAVGVWRLTSPDAGGPAFAVRIGRVILPLPREAWAGFAREVLAAGGGALQLDLGRVVVAVGDAEGRALAERIRKAIGEEPSDDRR